jgi:hypothetical protein
MEPDLGHQPTTKELQHELVIRELNARLEATEANERHLTKLVQSKNEQVIRLEAENLRLRMARTDKELTVQVEGLRKEVGLKDRALVDYKRQLDKFLENEKILLRRTAIAEQKVATVQETLVQMQRSRDAAHDETEVHEKDRLEAVGQMVAASDRARRLEERLAKYEKPAPAKYVPGPIAKK